MRKSADQVRCVMERIQRIAALMVIAIAAGACGGSDKPSASDSSPSSTQAITMSSLAGTWECARGSDDPTTARLNADGTMTMTFPDGATAPPGPWSIDGDQGRFGTESDGESFTVEDGKIVFGDETVCTKKS